jgi:secreted trypsin-like serine protease
VLEEMKSTLVILAVTVLKFSQLSANSDSLRIVGGSEISISQVPYQISLQQYGKHFCGGSLIGG